MIKLIVIAVLFLALLCTRSEASQRPNVVFIYTDDLGFGDIGCNGATKIRTPNIDRLAAQGMRFTNGRAAAATCTPSRYALMTGKYAWRTPGTGILPGDAALIVPADQPTLPGLFKKAGYATGIVGKWHLGLGTAVEKDWNSPIAPGPNEVGFDYSFIFPATADRVPTVFLENGQVLGLNPSDPIAVSYAKPIGSEPTGKDHPELLKMKSSPNHGHDQTIVNGIGRIGYMSGGRMARWTDEELPLAFLAKAQDFINSNRDRPFFLHWCLTEPHVPRVPSTMFKGKSGLGARGDVILQIDWAVGRVMDQLEQLGIAGNTMIIFTSDNGPVLDDGYEDEAVTKLNGHTPGGPFRGGKYSAFEAGTRVPFIVSWPDRIKPGVSDALLCQMDMLATFAELLGQKPESTGKLDSVNVLPALLGEGKKGRAELVVQGGTLSIIRGDWKYISPSQGPARSARTGIETGQSQAPQLYDLASDPGETNNLADVHPDKVRELRSRLDEIRKASQ